MLIFDTSVLIDIEQGRVSEEVIDALQRQSHDKPAVPFMVYTEYLHGSLKRKSKSAAIKELSLYTILHSTTESAILQAELQVALEKKGLRKPVMDLLIASITIAHRGILVTKDRDFEGIPGLDVIFLA